MHSFNPLNLKFLRRSVLAMSALIGVAIVATPATAAATDLTGIDGGALAAILAFGVLLFAIVFEVWRMTLKSAAPVRNRATHDWTPDRD